LSIRKRSAIALLLALAALSTLPALAAGATKARKAGKRAAPPTAAAASVFPYPVEETTLDNGFRIVTIPYDSPGTIAYYTLVRTGSRDEVEKGHSGFAHFFEHMMFRGTAKYSQKQYADLVKRLGADSNATTSDDWTRYYLVGPSSELETMMDMESDRFQNLKYDEQTFRTESLAVYGEYNKSIASPFQPMIEKLRDLAYARHPYKHLPIGFVDDIKAMPDSYQYSLQFFQRFYRPENCILIVVGDVDPQKVVALAKRYYGAWQRGYKAPDIEPEPPQSEAKTGHIDWPSPIHPQMVVGYHVPAFSVDSPDSAALELVGQLLFSDSAPLYQDLVVNKQWVDFIGSDSGDHRDPYLFTITSRVHTEDQLAKVKEAVDQAIAGLQKGPIDPQRLARIKSHLRYEFALGLVSPRSVADAVTEALYLTGRVDTINRRFEQYQKLTAADVQRVAQQVFRPQNETFVTVSHKAGPKTGTPGAAQGGSHE